MRFETGLKLFEPGIPSDNHFIEVLTNRAPLDTIVSWAVADVLPVFGIRLVSNKGTAISTAKAVVQGCVLAERHKNVAG